MRRGDTRGVRLLRDDFPVPGHDDLVRRSFERQTALFSGPDSPFARRAPGMHAWIEPLDASMTVLDVACGAAHAGDAIAPLVRAVVGVDITRALLDIGAQRLRDAGVDNILLHVANSEALPFVDEAFDVVFCRSSLHHIGHPDIAVAEMVRVCRTGGRIVLVDLVAPHDDETHSRFDDVHRMLDPSHLRTFTESELAALLPGGADALVYAETSDIRLPIDIAMTEQSDRDGVLALLDAELDAGPPTGFAPAADNGNIVVSFTTCTVHGVRS